MGTGVIFISSEMKKKKGERILQEARDEEVGDDDDTEGS